MKTMFGVPPAPIPVGARHDAAPASRSSFAATILTPSARLPSPKNPLPRLPSAEEARQNPNLVISLDVTPPPGQPSPTHARGNAADVATSLAGPNTTADVPGEAIPVDLPPAAGSGIPVERAEGPLTDLPSSGRAPRVALPDLPDSTRADASGASARRAAGSLAERLAANVKSIIELLAWAATTYLRSPKAYFLLAALLVMPASILQSCLVAGVVSRTTSLPAHLATVDFSARKAELAARIQESQARGQIDQLAVAELATLTAAETAHGPVPSVKPNSGASWVRIRLALLIQGLLVLGLAFPMACGALAIAFFDQQSGAAMPAFADIWPILLARGELILVSLLPAALLVALGNALFVLPGLLMSVLFLYLPHVVLFEKKGGRLALRRSIDLTKSDPIRTVLTFMAFALAGAAVALLTELLLPTSGSRAVAFLHFIACDFIAVAVLPIPALVLARLYLDLRGRTTSALRLSHAARS